MVAGKNGRKNFTALSAPPLQDTDQPTSTQGILQVYEYYGKLSSSGSVHANYVISPATITSQE
jgi:hypothetical protein